MTTPRPTRRPVKRTAVVVALVAALWFGGVLSAAREDALARTPAAVVGLVGVALLLGAHLWASRGRWLLSIALVLVPGLLLFASPSMTASDRAALGYAVVAVAAVLLLATTATAAWAGNRWGDSGPMGKVTDLF